MNSKTKLAHIEQQAKALVEYLPVSPPTNKPMIYLEIIRVCQEGLRLSKLPLSEALMPVDSYYTILESSMNHDSQN